MPKRLTAALLLTGLLAAIAGPMLLRAADPKTVAPFKLPDPRTTKTVALADFKDKKAIAVVFLGTECPVNNLFLPVLARLHADYESKGVQFLGVNSNVQDTPERVAAHAKKAGLPFPVLKDEKNLVADQFKAERTPEVFLLEPSGKILYHGRIDDQFGVGYQRPDKPTRRDLAEAIDEVLAGKPVSKPTTEVSGCVIGRAKKGKDEGTVTYAKHVSRIVQNKCQECHRPGQIGPFALMNYDDAVAWSGMIKEVVTDGRMPPWHADPRHGKFSNDRSLSKEDKETLLKWIEDGTPKGDDKDLPKPRPYPEGWTVGKPDVIFSMPKAFKVPEKAPKNGVEYKYFEVKTNFEEDKWIERAECKPGAPEVVHHIIIFVVGENEFYLPGRGGNVLVGTAPGDMPLMLKPGYAKKIPKKARLVFQMHYTPNGKEQEDLSSVGLVFAKEPPKHEVFTRPVINPKFPGREIKIPANDGNFKVEAETTFRADAHILHFMPHMHLRGKDFFIESETPDGKKNTLLSIPRYDFNWQSVYRLAEPIAMPKGAKLKCMAHFDNSTKNLSNPDPTQDVYWGDQTWEEMMIGWVDLYYDAGGPPPPPNRP